MKKIVVMYGGLGLIPFIAAGALFPIWPFSNHGFLIPGFLNYSAVILAFLAGSVWGISVKSSREQPAPLGLTVAIVFSLVAVFALLMPYPMSVYLLAFSYTILFILELVLMFRGIYPFWYTVLRGGLTFVVVICHIMLWYWLRDSGFTTLPVQLHI